MAKISAYTSVDPLDGTEALPVVQVGTTKKSLISDIKTWLMGYFTSGPASSTDNALARYDGTGGKTVQNSAATLSDNGALTLTGATLTATEPAVNVTQTWNSGAIAFTGLKSNITNTASSSSSLLLDLQVDSATKFRVDVSGAALADTVNVGATDVVLARGAANTLSLRNSTNAQTFRLFSTYTSGTSYQRVAMTCAKQTLSNVSGATVATTGNFIPDGACLMGVTTRINTSLGTSNGTTGYKVGNGSDDDLWGAAAAVTAGTATQTSDFTANNASFVLYTSAGEVTLTAVGGNFNGTGIVEVSAFYFLCEAD